jgi:carbamoylphosphate synthase small subunit
MCLGAQLLAAAGGGRAFKLDRLLAGWLSVPT